MIIRKNVTVAESFVDITTGTSEASEKFSNNFFGSLYNHNRALLIKEEKQLVFGLSVLELAQSSGCLIHPPLHCNLLYDLALHKRIQFVPEDFMDTVPNSFPINIQLLSQGSDEFTMVFINVVLKLLGKCWYPYGISYLFLSLSGS